MRLIRPVRRRLHVEHGFVTAQFAMVIPVVLFAVVAAIHGAAYLHAQRIVQAAAEDGAEAARANNGSPTVGRTVALDTVKQLAGGSVTDVSVNATGDAERAVVEVVGHAAGPLGTLTVRAVSSGPVERFRPETASAR